MINVILHATVTAKMEEVIRTDTRREATTIEDQEVTESREVISKAKEVITTETEKAVTIGAVSAEKEEMVTRAIENLAAAIVISKSLAKKSSTNLQSIQTPTIASTTAMIQNSSPRLLARRKDHLSSRSISSQATRSLKRKEQAGTTRQTLRWTSAKRRLT